jgi:hypothetical protein
MAGKVRRDVVRAGLVLELVRRGRAGAPLTDDHSPLEISLTSHGARLTHVPLAIESIARGGMLPAALTLWVDPGAGDCALRIPRLRRQVERGLRIRESSQALGPHTKYFPHLSRDGARRLLVTADDDVLYPRNWLSDLWKAHQATPDNVVCHRAHRFSVREGRVLPYRHWPPVDDIRPHPTVFPTGVNGVLYPEMVQGAILDAGLEFLRYAPTADDVWLHFVTISRGFSARQVANENRLFPAVPLSQRSSLVLDNLGRSGNDAQIDALYGAEPGAELLPLLQ